MDRDDAARIVCRFMKRVRKCPLSLDCIPFARQMFLSPHRSHCFDVRELAKLAKAEGMRARNPLTRQPIDPIFMFFAKSKSTPLRRRRSLVVRR